MSWFKHRPRPGDTRPTVPHQTGPITRNLWNQTKQSQESEKKNLKKINAS